MHHLTLISQARRPASAITLLEKQAITDLIQQNLTQIAVFINIISGFKDNQQ